jgi:hypothetical protein
MNGIYTAEACQGPFLLTTPGMRDWPLYRKRMLFRSEPVENRCTCQGATMICENWIGGGETELAFKTTTNGRLMTGPLFDDAYLAYWRTNKRAGTVHGMPCTEVVSDPQPLGSYWAIWGPGCCDPSNCWKTTDAQGSPCSEHENRLYGAGSWIAFERLEKGERKPGREIYYLSCEHLDASPGSPASWSPLWLPLPFEEDESPQQKDAVPLDDPAYQIVERIVGRAFDKNAYTV